jgi:DNA processing protein
MLTLHAAIALSLLPGRARFDVAARIRDRWPGLVTAPPSDGLSLEQLVEEVAPELVAQAALLRRLHGASAAALARAGRAGIAAITVADPAYPARLRMIADPPLVLWTRGTADTLRAPSVAIVGARAATPAGREMARWLATDLATEGVAVVSGLALGIDAAAHEGALSAGRTVAVLGAGTDVIYPASHRDLAERVARCGALVSEFVPGTAPHGHHFPLRNRIISGLALGVVVVEAAEHSGSLITARCALDQGRDVMACPGNPRSGRNRGAHGLLRDGARLVESARDVLDEIGWRRAESAPQGGRDDSPTAADPVLSALPVGEPLTLEELAAIAAVPLQALLAHLTELELAGDVERVEGGRFVRIAR